MELRKVSIRDNVYELVNNFGDCRDGFNHFTTLFKNGVERVEHKVHYINRTWECYTFETCMLGAVNTLIDIELDRYIYRYKQDNGIIRFRRGEKEQVINDFKQTDVYKELETLKQAIRDRHFD